MAPPLRVQEQAYAEKARPLRGGPSSRADKMSSTPERPSGIQAAGNQAVQRQAAESTNFLEPTHLEEPTASESEFVSRPSESALADEIVSRPEEVTIHFDPKRPWLYSVTGNTDEMAITAELYGEGISVPLEKRKGVSFDGFVPRVEDRYVVIPWLLRPYYVDVFNQAFEWRKTELDIEVKSDATEIKGLISKHIDLMRIYPIPPVEERVIAKMRHWADEPFPYRITDVSQNRPSGRYLDQLLLHLSDAYVEEGLFVDTWTNYHSLILNHFRRADEVRAIQDQHARVFADERALPEAPGFFDILWEDVKSGAVASRIKNYLIGMGQAAKGLLEGLHTLFTDPGKVIEAIGNLPQTLKALWQNKEDLWNQFLSASPDEQARMIGRLFGEAEILIATAGSGGTGRAATAAPGLATAEEVVAVSRGGAAAAAMTSGGTLTVDLGKLGGEAGRFTSLMAMAAEGAVGGKEKAEGFSSQENTKPQTETSVGKEPTENPPKGEEVWEELAKEEGLTKKGPPQKGLTPTQTEALLNEAKAFDTPESVSGNYRVSFKKLHSDFPGGKEWQVHHSIPQKFRATLKDAGVNVDHPHFLRGVRTTPGEFSNVHAKITAFWENWHAKFVKSFGRQPTAAEIIENAKEVDWRFGHVYWEAEKAAGIPVPTAPLSSGGLP